MPRCHKTFSDAFQTILNHDDSDNYNEIPQKTTYEHEEEWIGPDSPNNNDYDSLIFNNEIPTSSTQMNKRRKSNPTWVRGNDIN
jgi:hypothetical protein